MPDSNIDKIALENQIADLENQVKILNNQNDELEKQKIDLINFITSFNDMYNKCKTSFDSINKKVAEIKYEGSTVDSSLKDLSEINSGIAKITNGAIKNIDEKKQAIDKKVNDMEIYINNKINTIKVDIQKCNSLIEKYRVDISAL